MIRAIHIEDEPGNIELLQSLVATHCASLVKMEGAASNIRDAVALIREKRPQLVFLDIELNQGNAFELLEILKEHGDFDFKVIFLTAFNNYAVKAFRFNAVDYLLKPISIEELKEATAKAVDKIRNKEDNENILNVLKQLKNPASPQKIGFPVPDGVLFIPVEDIVRCEAKGGYTCVYLNNGKTFLAQKNLKRIEQLLPKEQFLRVHNSWTVNTKYLKKYFRGKQSYMQLEDGSTIPVSLRKKGNFLDLLSSDDKNSGNGDGG